MVDNNDVAIRAALDQLDANRAAMQTALDGLRDLLNNPPDDVDPEEVEGYKSMLAEMEEVLARQDEHVEQIKEGIR